MPAAHLSIFYRRYALHEWPTNSVKALKAKEMCDVTTYPYNAVHCQQPLLCSKQPHIPSFCLDGLWYIPELLQARSSPPKPAPIISSGDNWTRFLDFVNTIGHVYSARNWKNRLMVCCSNINFTLITSLSSTSTPCLCTAINLKTDNTFRLDVL